MWSITYMWRATRVGLSTSPHIPRPLSRDLPIGQIWQVGGWTLIIDAEALVTAERDLEEGFHVVVVWESYEWCS